MKAAALLSILQSATGREEDMWIHLENYGFRTE
jgi:hypothetical protein